MSPFLSRAPRFLHKSPQLLHLHALAPPQKILGLCLLHRAVATPEHPDSYSLRLLPRNTQAPPSGSGSTSRSTQAPTPEPQADISPYGVGVRGPHQSSGSPAFSLLPSIPETGWVGAASRLTATWQVGCPGELRLHLPASGPPTGRVRKRSGQVLRLTQPGPSVD